MGKGGISDVGWQRLVLLLLLLLYLLAADGAMFLYRCVSLCDVCVVAIAVYYKIIMIVLLLSFMLFIRIIFHIHTRTHGNGRAHTAK